MLAAPTYTILLTTQHEPDLTTADKVFTGIQLLLVVSEWFSDQQQWGESTQTQRSPKANQADNPRLSIREARI